jgi:hypothetical protein
MSRSGKQIQKSKKLALAEESWKTREVDPKALFIWETKERCIVVGRVLAFAVISIIGGTSLWNTSGTWVSILVKLLH